MRFHKLVAQLGLRQYSNAMFSVPACNDEHYSVKRCRTLPVVETITHIPSYPTTLCIFCTNASRFWQMRLFLNGRTIIRSTRTTSKREAVRIAKQFYNNALVHRSHQPKAEDFFKPITHSIEEVAEMMLRTEKARVDRKEMAIHSYTMLVSRLQKHVIPYFKKMAVEDILYRHIEEFLNFLSTKNYKPMTLSQYLMALRKVMNTAQANKWIEQVPQFPKIKITSTARGNFSINEYRLILRCAKELRKIQDTPNKVTHRNKHGGIYTATDSVPYEFSWLIRFMVNSFIRPVDVKIIQHQHVEIVRGEHSYLRLNLPETKKHRAQVITLPAAVHVYEKLKEYFAKQNMAKPTDYLFLPHITDRLAAITLMEKYFRHILVTTGLRYGTQGQRRTLYSLRHSAITFRLLYGQGIDLLTLARNARTSLEMVDKFYASELRAEMNVAMLHSRRNPLKI